METILPNVGMIRLYMKFKLNHGFLSFNRDGKGVPLLFIHGYPLSRKIWEPQRKGLYDIASMITIDLRGHGESFPFEPPYTMDMLAEDCARLLDHQKITEPVFVCGLSMGGYVTLALYRKYPHIFRGMILTSTRAGADSTEAKANREVAIKNVHEQGIAQISDDMLPKLVSPATLTTKPKLMHTIRAIMLEASVQGVIGASIGMRDRPDSSLLLPQIKVPVLIIHGADDQIIPLREAEIMHQQIPNSQLAIIAEAGHLPNMEQPEKFNQAVREFIRSLG